MMTALMALLFFSILIMVHELGHFLSARLVGIHAEEFSIGMGPAVFKFQGKETRYCLRILPIGGYVRFIGEDSRSDDIRAFGNAKLWKRTLVIISGSAMNFLLAVLLLSIYFMTFGLYEVVPEVYEVEEGTPAYNAGLLPGDKIIQINNTQINTDDPQGGIRQIRQIIDEKRGQTVDVLVMRNDQAIELSITPQFNQETGNYRIGVVFGRIRQLSFFSAIALSFWQTGRLIVMMIDMLGGMIFQGEGIGDVMGPVGIVGEIGRAVRYGIEQLMNLAIIISINLGIINLIPFPALDGGRLALLFVEGVRGKAIDPKKEGYIHLVGFVILMTLMALVTFRDIAR
jgi:regulator of sigma E protease